MAAEVLELFDFCWFQHLILRKKPSPSPSPSPPDPDHEPVFLESKLSRLPTLNVRSLSDQFLSSKGSFTADSLSPDSVLQAPTLQTIFSGKDVGEELDDAPKKEERRRPVLEREVYCGRKRKGSSKSLSDLEFEELKGFMDLGFVFSEEDKNSKLVSIVPGLQRLGKKGGDEDDEEEGARIASVSRPYLSEAWDVLDSRRKEVDPLLDWRIPTLGNEVDMKDHLRYWAHAVASALR